MAILESALGNDVRVGLADGPSLEQLEGMAEDAVDIAVLIMSLHHPLKAGIEALEAVMGSLAAAADGITLHLVMSRRAGLSSTSTRQEVLGVSADIRTALFGAYDLRLGTKFRQGEWDTPGMRGPRR